MATIRNLTPHPANIILGEVTVTIPQDPDFGGKNAPRIATSRELVANEEVRVGLAIYHIPTHKVVMGEAPTLPPEEEGVILLVPRLVAEHAAFRGRKDLRIPDEAVRDTEGKIIGVKGLSVL